MQDIVKRRITYAAKKQLSIKPMRCGHGALSLTAGRFRCRRPLAGPTTTGTLLLPFIVAADTWSAAARKLDAPGLRAEVKPGSQQLMLFEASSSAVSGQV